MRRVHLALIAVQVLFGLWPVAGSAVLGVLSPQALERRLRGLVGAGPRPPSVVLEHRELAARLIEFARGLG